MNPRVPPVIQPLIQAYLEQIETSLPGLLNGYYLTGSIALDGFNPLHSDIDFVTVLARPIRPVELTQLAMVHKTIARAYPRWKMEGGYYQPTDLGRFEEQVVPYPCYHGGKFDPAGRHEANAINWWLLKNRAVAVKGPEPAGLPFAIEWNVLIERMHHNTNTYWASWVRQPRRLLTLLSDWGVQWAVLGILRQFYTFRENAITTKTGAGEYALPLFPRWRRLIQTAIDLREKPPYPHLPLNLNRAFETKLFLVELIELCNSLAV